MAVASFPVVINSIGASRLNLKNRVVTVVFINAFCAIVTLGLGYALLLSMGLAGIGIAFALAQGVVMILFISGVIRF
jgi:O-antigen/teichoic acid export membrane protein